MSQTEEIKKHILDKTSFVNSMLSHLHENKSKLSFDDARNLLNPLFDFGREDEAYEACETLSEQESVDTSKEMSASFAAKLFLAQSDVLRKRHLEEHRAMFEHTAKHAHPYARAHSFSALAIFEIYDGNLETSLSHFETAADLFGETYKPEYFKTKVRRLMVLRMLERYDDATKDCETLLEEARKNLAKNITIVVYCYATLGSAILESGSATVAKRYLVEAAKLSKLLPPSPSAAFSMFQYAQVLMKLHSPKEALPWLEKSYEIQRLKDPMASVATRIVLMSCYRELGRYNEANDFLKNLIGSKLLTVDPEASFEALKECVLLASEICDFGLMSQVEKFCETQEDLDAEHLKQLLALAKTSRDRWQNKKTWKALEKSAQPLEFFVDFEKREIVKHVAGKRSVERFRQDSGTQVLLSFLFYKRSVGHLYFKQKELAHVLVSQKGDSKVLDESVSRQLKRALEDLVCQECVLDVGEAVGFGLNPTASFSVIALAHESKVKSKLPEK